MPIRISQWNPRCADATTIAALWSAAARPAEGILADDLLDELLGRFLGFGGREIDIDRDAGGHQQCGCKRGSQPTVHVCFSLCHSMRPSKMRSFNIGVLSPSVTATSRSTSVGQSTRRLKPTTLRRGSPDPCTILKLLAAELSRIHLRRLLPPVGN